MQRQTVIAILRIIPGVMRFITSDLRRRDIAISPAHLGLLFALSERPRSLGELAELQEVSLPTMSSTIRRLAAKGWLHCERDPQDRRRLLIHLTEAGRDVLSKVYQHAEDVVFERIQALSLDACEKLLAGLSLLQQAFHMEASSPTEKWPPK